MFSIIYWIFKEIFSSFYNIIIYYTIEDCYLSTIFLCSIYNAVRLFINVQLQLPRVLLLLNGWWFSGTRSIQYNILYERETYKPRTVNACVSFYLYFMYMHISNIDNSYMTRTCNRRLVYDLTHCLQIHF